MPIQLLKRYLQLETSSSFILFLAAILSMILANSPLAPYHQRFIDQFIFLINDGLMAIFFAAVGIELKKGYLDGQLASFSQIALPLAGAIGGMLVPALIYCFINRSSPETLVGWATPVATDIAFALGVLALAGRRISISLKLFLLTLAIFDDIGAIIIIAVFYTSGGSYGFLLLALLPIIGLILLNINYVRSLTPYVICGMLLWFCLLKSGVHPTIAGVLFALAIPEKSDNPTSPLRRLEHGLHPWVAYLIMPLFALANAGVSLATVTWESLFDVVVLGIALGLFLGKQIGVFLFSWLLIRSGAARLPEKTSWRQLYGVALLCGIGFTMSLFLGTLSFQNESIYLAEVRLGVLLGSLLSALVGALILIWD